MQKLDEMEIQKNYPTSCLSCMGVGGVCDMFCKAKNQQQLLRAIGGRGEYFLIGGGANVVFGDEYHGIVIKLSGEFKEINAMGTHIVCGGGASLVKVCKMASELGLAGLSGLCGIPGSVGGGVKGNCGAFGFEIGNAVEWVEITSEKGILRVNKSLCGFEYRNSKLPKGVITKVCFNLEKSDKNHLQALENHFRKMRISTQPKEKSCGSVFKRAMGTCVSKKIEEAGLKGYRVGGLEVSKLHAGFVVNKGGGTPSDYIKITQKIQSVLQEKFNLQVESEVKFVGNLI